MLKTALVAGGTSGVGLSIVRELVKNNYNVFFIGSNQQKGKLIEAELRSISKSDIHFIQLDLSKVKDVTEFANTFIEQNAQLDLLLNVAGVVLPLRQETSEGIEKTFATGYLSAFILSNTLSSLLEKTKGSRILNVSGDPALIFKLKLNFDDLNFTKNYNGFKAAIATIHAKTVLTAMLSEKLLNKNIDVNSFHPGFVKSDLTRHLPFLMRILVGFISPFMPLKSKNGIYVSMADSLTGISGKLFVNKKPIPLNFDTDYKSKLWQETEKIIAKALTK